MFHQRGDTGADHRQVPAAPQPDGNLLRVQAVESAATTRTASASRTGRVPGSPPPAVAVLAAP